MKKILISLGVMFSSVIYSQIIVNKEDIKDKVDEFEVWAFKKPFTSKDCYFINYGQKKFTPSNYDLLGQGIIDKDGNKFEKGEWLRLSKYLREQGFKKESEREEYIGDLKGRVITFIKE